MDSQMIAIGLSGLTLIILVLEKTFGGGNTLAAKFAQLDKETTAALAQLRSEITSRVDSYEDNYAVGIDAIKANIHAIQIGLLEFRAKMAEEYMHKTDYNAGLASVKQDLRDGFDRLEMRLNRIEENTPMKPKIHA